MDLNEILVFERVVQVGSFVGAARELGMPTSTVSRRVAQLEKRLGARLLQRTTRRLHLTEVGHTFFLHAARVAAELERAEQAVARLQDEPRGLLRITMPMNFGYLSPIFSTFMETYPEVTLDVLCVDRIVHLVEEGFDLAIRVAELRDSTLIARHLGELRNVVVASPAYLDARGVPERPADLEGHHCVVFGGVSEPGRWTLRGGDKTVTVSVKARCTTNDFDLIDEAARAGIGIAMVPIYRCVEDLRAGRLRRVLLEWHSPEVPIQAVYPSTRHLSPKVRAFLDHVSAHLTPSLWELADPHAG